MKFLIGLTTFCLLSTTAMAGNMQHLGCNPATQNWVNGSGKTCPPLGAGASKTRRAKPWAPPVVTPPDDDDDDGGVDDPPGDDDNGGVDDPPDDGGGVDDPPGDDDPE